MSENPDKTPLLPGVGMSKLISAARKPGQNLKSDPVFANSPELHAPAKPWQSGVPK